MAAVGTEETGVSHKIGPAFRFWALLLVAQPHAHCPVLPGVLGSTPMFLNKFHLLLVSWSYSLLPAAENPRGIIINSEDSHQQQ